MKKIVFEIKISMDGLKNKLYITSEFVLWDSIGQRERKYKREVKRYVRSSEYVKITYLSQVVDIEKSKNGAQVGFEGISRHGKRQ